MSSSLPSSTQSPSNAPTHFPATSNDVPQMASSTASNSTPVITQSSTQPSLCTDQQLTAATNLSVPTDISEEPENVFEHFRFSCESTASPNAVGEEEWDFLDEIKPLVPLQCEGGLEMETDEEISDADDVEDSEVLDELKHLILLPPKTSLYSGEEISDEEWEVLHEFKPLIPLPPHLAIGRGKNEQVSFKHMANQYKFVDQEWKEQNLCLVAILYNLSNSRARILMSQNGVVEVCANHYITHDMKIHPVENLDQAWTWVAQEFVDGELKPEHFCIRFQFPELADAFEFAFLSGVDIARDSLADDFSSSEDSAADSHVVADSIELRFNSIVEPWRCDFCKAINGLDNRVCYVCKEMKPREYNVYPNFPVVSEIKITERLRTNNSSGSNDPTTETRVISKLCAFTFAPKQDMWCCSLCETLNGISKKYCVVCETTRHELPSSDFYGLI